MSIQTNTIANYIGKGYTALVGIVMLSLYLQYLGPEAYGLVGFFTMMQAWLALLDMGLSPTLSWQVAYKRGQAGEKLRSIRKLLRSIEIVFFVLAASIAFVCG
ncbi:MAG: oligosaccharide flippase family protein [Planctomycetes bacterium]|nr:oligosaccharide flippase family protein [Planctomycetota bacterium]